jgi:hypothetical protein
LDSTIIGLGGRKTAGKDTVADYLVDEYGYVKLGMSDALNEAAMILNPWILADSFDPIPEGFYGYADIVETYGYTAAKNVREVREFLKKLGTEVGRDIIGVNTWVDAARKRIVQAVEAGKPVAITGIRYPNEVALIRQLGGKLWWVERPGVGVGDEHTSENAVWAGDFDTTIWNKGTVKDLQWEVDYRFGA